MDEPSIPEIVNRDVIAAIVAGAKPDAKAKALLGALQGRYPALDFRASKIAESGYTAQGGIVDSTGALVAADRKAFLEVELAKAGGNVRAVWAALKDKGWLATTTTVARFYVRAITGPKAGDFVQLTCAQLQEVADRHLFSEYAPSCEREMSDPSYVSRPGKRLVLGPPRYQLEGLDHAGRLAAEMTRIEVERRRAFDAAYVFDVPQDYGTEPPAARDDLRAKPAGASGITISHIYRVRRGTVPGPGRRIADIEEVTPGYLQRVRHRLDRLFEDWDRSSAGRMGHRYAEYWAIRFTDYTGKDQVRHLDGIPQAIQPGLPEIRACRKDGKPLSAYQLMDKLEAFDRKAGYPFAWFFHMTHGGRIEYPDVGVAIADAVKGGRLSLPKCDREVLMDWSKDQYGF